MEVLVGELHGVDLLVGDFDRGAVAAPVKACVDLQSGAGGGRADQVRVTLFRRKWRLVAGSALDSGPANDYRRADFATKRSRRDSDCVRLE